MDLIKLVYGKNVDLYTDVLRVQPQATDKEIQSAFVARRYELFNKLQSASDTKMVKLPKSTSGSPEATTMSEKQFTENKLDALIATYRLLSDSEKRRQYNMSVQLSAQKSRVPESPRDVSRLDQMPVSDHKITPMNASVANLNHDNRINGMPSYNYKMNRGPSAANEVSPTLPSVKKKLFDSSPDDSALRQVPSSKSNVNNCEDDGEVYHDGTEGTRTDRQSFESSSYVSGSVEESSLDDDYANTLNGYKNTAVRQVDPNQSHDSTESNGMPQDRKVRWSKSTDKSVSKRERQKRNQKKASVLEEEDDDDSEEEEEDGEDAMWSKHRSRRVPQRKAQYKKNRNRSFVDESEEDSEDCRESGMLSSWLRANNLMDQADMVDNISREIAGAAADTVLAFNQILNAFTIDDEAIDSVASNIVDATEDLESFKS